MLIVLAATAVSEVLNDRSVAAAMFTVVAVAGPVSVATLLAAVSVVMFSVVAAAPVMVRSRAVPVLL